MEVGKSVFTRCLRCNRLLRTPQAKARGYGDICWKKYKEYEQLFANNLLENAEDIFSLSIFISNNIPLCFPVK